MQDKSMCPASERTLAEITMFATEHIQRLGYSPDSVRHYAATWRRLVCFAERRGSDALTSELGEAFLDEQGIPGLSGEALTSSWQRHKRAAMRILLEFQQWGSFTRRRPNGGRTSPPAVFEYWFDGYMDFCVGHLGTAFRTMRGRRRNVVSFLEHLDASGITDLVHMTAGHLGNFMASRIHLQPKTLALVASDLRGFLRYLVMNGIVDACLIDRVPKIRIAPDERIPDVWTEDEVRRLLAIVDRGSPVGKRDYAILLLAAKLGMRAGDIRDLQIEEIRWDVAHIERKQCKTGAPLLLPLGEEIGAALIDYLRHGRPPSPRREVFLRSIAPFEPFASNNNLHSIITTYRRRAGIALSGRSRQGLHSLRHTAATKLLESGAPMEAIASVLGHASWESTLIYTKVNLPALRRVALDPEDVPSE